MKQKYAIFVVFSVLLTVLLFAGCKKPPEKLKVENFNLSDYKQEMVDFPPKENYEIFQFTNAEDVLTAADMVIADVFDNAEEKKPYYVYYDESTKVWLVKGSLPKGMKGGVPHVIFSEQGEVLAVWHTK